MNKFFKIFIIFILTFCAAKISAQVCVQNDVCTVEEEHEHEETAEVELSETAIKNYGIKTQKPFPSALQKLPRAALVAAQDKYFIYEKEGVHFKEIEIRPESVTDKFVIFKDTDYKAEKEYVVSGGVYLRIIFLSNSAPAEGHGH